MSGVLKYFESKKNKQADAAPPPNTLTTEEHSPVLTDADEEFLRRLASENQGLEEPSREVAIAPDGKAAGLEGPETVPLPASPPVTSPAGRPHPHSKPPKITTAELAKIKGKEALQYVQARVPFSKDYARQQAGGHIHDVAHAVKTGEPLSRAPDPEKERKDVANLLSKLNLSAINNKAFSFSKDSQKLFDRFTQILKDIVNGVPTAYHDLEKLLTDSDKQLKEMFDKMPPFMQNLIKSLPTKMTATVAPGLAAAMSEKSGADGKLNVPTGKSRLKIPALKNLVKGDAVIAMLRSILSFLRLRFPTALAGANVMISLAVFLLLFVFWYCYKRGRQVRLEKEAADAVARAGETGESEADASDVELEDEDREALEAALRHPHPAQVPLPLRTISEQELK